MDGNNASQNISDSVIQNSTLITAGGDVINAGGDVNINEEKVTCPTCGNIITEKNIFYSFPCQRCETKVCRSCGQEITGSKYALHIGLLPKKPLCAGCKSSIMDAWEQETNIIIRQIKYLVDKKEYKAAFDLTIEKYPLHPNIPEVAQKALATAKSVSIFGINPASLVPLPESHDPIL